MEQTTSPLSLSETWDAVADAYTLEIMPVFETASIAALRLAGVSPGMKIVDVACGPGTLSRFAAKAGAQVSALDFSPEMIARLTTQMALDGIQNIEATLGDGMALPYQDGSFDAAFSMFGLMFFPDRARGFSELYRVLRPGAGAVVSSWAPLSQILHMSTLFEVLGSLLPEPPPPPRPLPLSEPQVCISEMSAAGFRQVQSHQLAVPIGFSSTEAMVESFGRSNAMLVPLRKKLGEGFHTLLKKLSVGLVERLGPGPQSYDMMAHLTAGLR